MKNQMLITGVAIVAVGAAAFFGGMQYAKSQRGGRAQFMGQNQLGRGNQDGGFRPVSGEVLSSDDKSITVKLSDGSSKIVLLSDSTSITESTSAGKQQLQSGKQVAVFGTTNSDGSVTAQNIQLNPQFKGMNSRR